MTKLGLIAGAPLDPVGAVAIGLAAGAVIGAWHFLTLRWNVRLLAQGRSVLLPLGVQLARFAVVAAALAGVAGFFGALSLLAALGGILAARTAIVRREAPP